MLKNFRFKNTRNTVLKIVVLTNSKKSVLKIQKICVKNFSVKSFNLKHITDKK